MTLKNEGRVVGPDGTVDGRHPAKPPGMYKTL